MTFEEKWDYFSEHAQFDSRIKWIQTALSYIKNNAPQGTVDFSFKSVNDKIYFNRLNVKFKDNPRFHYEQWYQDILKIGKSWKIAWPDNDIQSFFNALDWSQCHSFTGGFDLRAKIEKSRLKFWCEFSSDNKTLQQLKLTKYCPFDKNILAPFWKKYASKRICFGWVYSGNGDVSWRAYPEVSSIPIVLGSKHPIVQTLGPLSERMSTIWPSHQPSLYWGHIYNKDLFLRELLPLLCSTKAINLAKAFQKRGFILSNVGVSLPVTKKSKITESNFYFR